MPRVMMPMHHHPIHRQRGATLIEVMVSALIVAFGVLAMIALQANSIKFSKTSEYRSVATLLANDLADRMRINAAAAIAGSYNLTSVYSNPSSTIPTRTNCTVETACTPTELATRDLGEWRRALFFGLPGGDGYVLTDTGNRTVDIWVAWRDPGQTTAAANDGTRSNNGGVSECPTAFIPSSSDTNPPRCMFFRISLPPNLTPPAAGT